MRIAVAVRQCNDCPFRQYDSGGRYECDKAKAPLLPGVAMPEWCPLPQDHPQAIARAERMLAEARAVLKSATAEARDGASPERLRDLLQIAAQQLARYS